MKSTVEEIRQRFSNLQTGQSATVDVSLAKALVFDLVESSIPAVQQLMRQQYGECLTRLKDEAYRDHVFAYVEKEDTPRPLLFQLDLLSKVGFAQVEVLDTSVCFAAFGAVKG